MLQMTNIARALEGFFSWEGSLDELVATASNLLEQNAVQGQALRVPTRSLVESYRKIGLISPALGKRYQWLHFVQLVVGCVLVQLGQKRKVVAKRFVSLAPSEIIALLNRPDLKTEPVLHNQTFDDSQEGLALATAHEVVLLLAAGLIEHYRRARAGELLVHDKKASENLRVAIFRLAGLYVQHGLPVQADGVHTLVAKCVQPLCEHEWGLPVFDSPAFRFYGVRLLDEASRLPTIECVDMARTISSELDLLEQQAFAQLNAACDLFTALRGEEVYSALREFIVRHPITTEGERRRFVEGMSLQAVNSFLASCYEPPQPHHLVKGALFRCESCGSPMAASVVDGHVCCPVRQCGKYDLPVPRGSSRQVTERDSLVAKAHILAYWCGPGRDEIALYDTAVKNEFIVTLYPQRDKYDLFIEQESVAIDVKSHASPFLLADTLNRDLGGLGRFSGKKYVAINDQTLSRFPGYLDILRRECGHLGVEFIAVSSLRRKLRARA